MTRARLPHPLYVRARGQLEQAMALLSHNPEAPPLITLIDEALDIAIELAYLPPTNETVLRLKPSDEVRVKPDRD